MPADTAPLKFQEKLGYGLGDTASNFFFQVFNLFLLYYYTDVFGLAPAVVGTMFLTSFGRQYLTGFAVTRCLFRRIFRPPAS